MTPTREERPALPPLAEEDLPLSIENGVALPRAVSLETEIGDAPQFGGDCRGRSWCGH